MNKKKFIYNILKKHGDYKEDDIVIKDEKEMIEDLAIKQLEFGLVKDLYSEELNEKRAKIIYSYVKNFLPKNVDSFLDFGGGTCDISYFLGNMLGAKNIYCVDIEKWVNIDWKRRDDVIFYLDTKKIKTGSINVLLVSHTLHHIKDDEIKEIIKEFNRILADNGIIILHEHNSTEGFDELLDLQHILYDTVISQINDYETYKKKFYSNYKSISEWNQLFNRFALLKIIKKKSYDRSYFAIYKKIPYFINTPNRNNLKISNTGKFSVTHYKDAIKIGNIIKSYFDKDITITDATANNGGNTIIFGFMFEKVNSVEINKKEYDILVNNIKVYKLKNITTYNDDYLNIYDTLKQDVIFIDPPWGGPRYKNKKGLNLFLSGKNLINVIDMLTSKIVVLKVPFNFNFEGLFKYGRFTKKIHLYVFLKYVIVVLLNRDSNLENYKKINII
jgi:ubiquinone/menaquinone biosynthesis C-methylase UbiE